MITLRTLFGYLLGNASSIRRVASHPRSLRIGFAFVIAAGFAREYDGEDLLREPWHLALPLVASLVTSWVLYALLRLVASSREERLEVGPGAFHDGYPAFLRLYWWTAPLALLYGIPFERCMGPADATAANLSLLGIVATWRVILITRAISVTWRVPYVQVLMPVMLFADFVALCALFAIPFPVVAIMGGIRLTDSQFLIQSVAERTLSVGILTSWIWIVGSWVVSKSLRREGVGQGVLVLEIPSEEAATSKPLWVFVAASLLLWLGVLPFTQAEQRRRGGVEAALAAGDFAGAVAVVRGHERGAFPPHWDPPPRPWYGERGPDPVAVLAAALEGDAPYWFVSAYIEKVSDTVGANQLYEARRFRTEAEAQNYVRVKDALLQHRLAKRLATAHPNVLRAIVERALQGAPMPVKLEVLFEAAEG